MKKLAIIPWGAVYLKDQLFNINNKKINRDNSLMMFIVAKKYMEEKGWEVHTIDCYHEISDVDLIVFFHFDKEQYKRVFDSGVVGRTIYIAFEPPVVDQNHTEQGIKNLLKYFHYILTWNDSLVDNRRIFKFMYPYYFQIEHSNILFKDKKLLVNISGNKKSTHKYELYTEREKVINYFDNSSCFELYGTNWDSSKHPSYKGLADNKKDVYHGFKFALCLENMWNVDGYVTEKILDCFCAGIVPIYLGAKNIEDYIPDNCYIPYSRFSSIEGLDVYLNSITEEQYNDFLNNIRLYLSSDKKNVFLPSSFADSILNIVEMNKDDFQPTGNMFVIGCKMFNQKLENKLKMLIRKIVKASSHANKSRKNVYIGKNSNVDDCSVIGEYTYIGTNCLVTKATIGRYVSIGNNVSIGPGEHRLDRISTSNFMYDHKINWYNELTEKDVMIGNDVWIGTDSIVRRGVTIGDGAVIGANSFVNCDVPAYAIVAGNPAKFIRYRFSQTMIEKVQKSEWWQNNLDEARRIVEEIENDINN